VGREGRAEYAVGVKGVQYMVVASSRPRLPLLQSRKIPNAWKARVRAVETLSQSIDIPRSFQPEDEIRRRGAIHDNEIIIGGAYD
jgi:hypothetical protein